MSSKDQATTQDKKTAIPVAQVDYPFAGLSQPEYLSNLRLGNGYHYIDGAIDELNPDPITVILEGNWIEWRWHLSSDNTLYFEHSHLANTVTLVNVNNIQFDDRSITLSWLASMRSGRFTHDDLIDWLPHSLS